MNILFTFLLAIILTSIFGVLLVLIHSWAQSRLGERSSSACEVMGINSEHCCQYTAYCPEEIRNKCKHAKI